MKGTGDTYWEGAARTLVEKWKALAPQTYPPSAGIILSWRGKSYVGSIQEIAPGFSNEIVALSKTSHPVPEKLAGAIRKLNTGWLELRAESLLDLTGRQHIVRRLGDRLTFMTPEQTDYMLKHPPNVHEISEVKE